MSKSSNSAESVEYDTTLVLAIELSSKTWVLAAQVPSLPKTKAKRTIEPDKLVLQSAIDQINALESDRDAIAEKANLDEASRMIQQLCTLRDIGVESATVLVREAFS